MKPKKYLGQHFLVAGNVIVDIVREASITKEEVVLEIGPGKGILTETLLSAGARVIAVEKDTELVGMLREKFSEEIKSGQLNLVNGDILKLKLKHYKLQAISYKLVSNIPYYITGEILRKFVGGEIKPSKAVLLVQKEVAERVVAKNTKENILSISIKAYGDPRYVKKVPAGCFNPPPKVDSAILSIENIKQTFAGDREQTRFFKILKTGFAHKRKKLAGNLSVLSGKENALQIFDACGIQKNARAEDLKLEDWLCLSKLSTKN